MVPIGFDQGLTPEVLASYLSGVEHPPGSDVVAMPVRGVSTAEFADGATWILMSEWPAGDWYTSLRRAIRAGPAR